MLFSAEELEVSLKLFNKAHEEINNVLCDIRDILSDMAIKPQPDLDITPVEMKTFIKMKHWLVYREYENLMDYSHRLLNIIIKKEKFRG
jgi:hypothetical protein